jgi:hypothetical protein
MSGTLLKKIISYPEDKSGLECSGITLDGRSVHLELFGSGFAAKGRKYCLEHARKEFYVYFENFNGKTRFILYREIFD